MAATFYAILATSFCKICDFALHFILRSAVADCITAVHARAGAGRLVDRARAGVGQSHLARARAKHVSATFAL